MSWLYILHYVHQMIQFCINGNNQNPISSHILISPWGHIWKCNTNTFIINRVHTTSQRNLPSPIHECKWRQKGKKKLFFLTWHSSSYSLNDAKDCAHCVFYSQFRTSGGFGKAFFCAFTFYDFLIPKIVQRSASEAVEARLAKLKIKVSKMWYKVDIEFFYDQFSYKVTQCVILCISKTF